MVLSDCPSIWGWYAELILSCVPNAAYIDCQNLDVNRGSRSDTMLAGTPCNLTTSLTYNSANLSIDSFWFIGKKWAHFVSRSTITQIASKPLVVLGKWVTKSIAMLSHFHWGISNGSRVPPGLWCSIFAFWQTRQDGTKSATFVFMPVHQNVAFKSLYILVIPGCMLRRLLWPSSKSIFLSTRLLGTHTLSLYRRMPSLPILKSFLFSVPNSVMICWSSESFPCSTLTSSRNSLVIHSILHRI